MLVKILLAINKWSQHILHYIKWSKHINLTLRYSGNRKHMFSLSSMCVCIHACTHIKVQKRWSIRCPEVTHLVENHSSMNVSSFTSPNYLWRRLCSVHQRRLSETSKCSQTTICSRNGSSKVLTFWEKTAVWEASDVSEMQPWPRHSFCERKIRTQKFVE